MLSTGMLGMLAARVPSFRIAPVTAAILLAAAPSHTDAFISALHRVVEITIGCGIGVAVALIVVPSRQTSACVRRRAARSRCLPSSSRSRWKDRAVIPLTKLSLR